MLLLASAVAFAAHAVDRHAGTAPVTASGAYTVTFHLNTPSTVPDGAVVTCKARIAPRRSAFENLLLKAAPAESTPVVARVVASSASCTVQVPVAFSGVDPRNGADLGYEIDGFTSAGPVFVRAQQSIGIPYPKTGSTTNLHLNLAL